MIQRSKDAYDGPMMVPLADALNHVAAHNARVCFDNRRELSIRSVRHIEAGEEVFNTYGEHSNADLLHMYGFIERDEDANANDCVEMGVECMRDALRIQMGDEKSVDELVRVLRERWTSGRRHLCCNRPARPMFWSLPPPSPQQKASADDAKSDSHATTPNDDVEIDREISEQLAECCSHNQATFVLRSCCQNQSTEKSTKAYLHLNAFITYYHKIKFCIFCRCRVILNVIIYNYISTIILSFFAIKVVPYYMRIEIRIVSEITDCKELTRAS